MSDKVAQIIPFMYPYKIGTPAKMLFDLPRNRYYDTILMQCRDQVCADVGFGTGILTAIALYYGAKHVYAYELFEKCLCLKHYFYVCFFRINMFYA